MISSTRSRTSTSCAAPHHQDGSRASDAQPPGVGLVMVIHVTEQELCVVRCTMIRTSWFTRTDQNPLSLAFASLWKLIPGLAGLIWRSKAVVFAAFCSSPVGPGQALRERVGDPELHQVDSRRAGRPSRAPATILAAWIRSPRKRSSTYRSPSYSPRLRSSCPRAEDPPHFRAETERVRKNLEDDIAVGLAIPSAAGRRDTGRAQRYRQGRSGSPASSSDSPRRRVV